MTPAGGTATLRMTASGSEFCGIAYNRFGDASLL